MLKLSDKDLKSQSQKCLNKHLRKLEKYKSKENLSKEIEVI